MDSRLKLSLSVGGSIATGTWMEQTSPSGYYKGATYHATLQLIINPMGRAMSGRWLGFGKNFQVNTGEWELTWVDGSTSQRAIRQYHLRALPIYSLALLARTACDDGNHAASRIESPFSDERI